MVEQATPTPEEFETTLTAVLRRKFVGRANTAQLRTEITDYLISYVGEFVKAHPNIVIDPYAYNLEFEDNRITVCRRRPMVDTARGLEILDKRCIELIKIYPRNKSILVEMRCQIAYLKVGIDVENINPDGSDYHLMQKLEDQLARDPTGEIFK